jgi:hypothetical protein
MAKFKKGHKRSPKAGRKRGSQNLTTRVLKDAVILAAIQLGDLSGIKVLSKEGAERGKDGLVGYLRWIGKMYPGCFMSLLGRAMPMQVNIGNETASPRPYRSLDEIERDVAARGFSLREFGHLLIEATATEVKTADVGSQADTTCKENEDHGDD